MIKRHFYYYLLKPYIPLRLRMALRRLIAGWKRKKYASVWPINESAGRMPTAWPGWPDGKKFAVVLTHDVEGPRGLEKCRHLAELDMKMGFRSSFNFIPEGSYSVPDDLRAWLMDRGFEVGVHDLRHNGKLYATQAQFRSNAQRINRYIGEWKASGFRSAFMHHHQEWLHDLNVKYDASTFDTDPFEPQPDGVGTIFPFWVPVPDSNGQGRRGTQFFVEGTSQSGKKGFRSSNSPFTKETQSGGEGYVELPYTLPQDSTLFLLLQEPTGDIWQKKLDWIVRQKGMALMNVHPDYLHLQSGKPGSQPTAEDHYLHFLRYLTKSYGGTFWQPLPREMASFVRQL